MSRTVMILDDDDDLRETLAEMFQLMCGVETILAPDVEGMVAVGNEVLRCAIAFIDVNLGVPARYGVLSLPTVMIFVAGEPVEVVHGAQPRLRYADAVARALAA